MTKKVAESRSGSRSGSLVKQAKAGYETNNKKGQLTGVDYDEMTITKVGAANDSNEQSSI
jgi:hypothetical protein